MYKYIIYTETHFRNTKIHLAKTSEPDLIRNMYLFLMICHEA